MEHQNSSPQNNKGHLVLSYNLLKLLQWIIDYEAETLKQLVTRAVAKNFTEKYTNQEEMVELHIADETLQQSILEFLGLMDALLTDANTDHGANRFIQRTKLPVLDHIDTAICNESLVQNSIDRANSKLGNKPNANLQELVLQELLKQWKPAKKQIIN